MPTLSGKNPYMKERIQATEGKQVCRTAERRTSRDSESVRKTSKLRHDPAAAFNRRNFLSVRSQSPCGIESVSLESHYFLFANGTSPYLDACLSERKYACGDSGRTVSRTHLREKDNHFLYLAISQPLFSYLWREHVLSVSRCQQ